MAKQWQQPWEPLQPQAALPVLTILLNGNENHELTDCLLARIIDSRYGKLATNA
jgi:hypothetical protein